MKKVLILTITILFTHLAIAQNPFNNGNQNNNGGNQNDGRDGVPIVPEPSTIALFGLGLSTLFVLKSKTFYNK